MNVASTLASLIVLPIAWALLLLKRKLPARPDRRYCCILARLIRITPNRHAQLH